MLQIHNTIISFDILQEHFHCDLASCKGLCCVEGDCGAPVEETEITELEKVLPIIWNDLSPKAQAIIEQQGVVCLDAEGEYVTPIVAGEDCVYAYHDAAGVCRCSIEKAFREGKTDFYKPLSCHLYPVRVAKYNDFQAVNYHRWSVCRSAEMLGRKEKVAVYQFLKEPLIRKFGEEWYGHLCRAAEELRVENDK